MATATGSTIGALRVVIGADTTGLNRGLKEAQGGLGALRSAALPAVTAIAAVGAAATAVGVGLYNMVRAEMQVIDTQLKLARSVEGTVTGLRTLKWAAEDSGVDGLEQSLTRLNRRLGAVEMGVGPAAATVERLGLNLKELASVDVDERLARISDRIVESGMSAQEAARHLQNLGFQQAEAVQFFMQGGDAIRGAREEIEKYGLAVSELDARKIEEANNNFSRLGLIVDGLKTKLAVALSPALLETAQRLKLVADNLLDAVNNTVDLDEEAGELARNPLVHNFLKPAALAVAALTDAFVGLGRVIRAISGSFKVVGADIRGFIAMSRTAIEYANPANWFGGDALERAIENEKKVLAERRETIEKAGKVWKTLLEEPGNKFYTAVKDAFDAELPDLPGLGGGGGGGGGGKGGGGGGGAIAKENDQLQQRLENLRQFLATREDLEVQAAMERIELVERSLAAGLISEQEHNQMLFDLSGKFYDSMAKLREEKYQEQRDKLQELNDLEIISDAEYHARKLELLAQQEQEKTEALIEAFLQRKEILDEMVAEGDISEEEHKLRMEELEQAHQDELTRIVAQGAQARRKLDEAEAKKRQDVMSGMMGNLVQLMNSGNKEMFRIGKIAAIANALLKGRQAIVDAYQAGMSVGGPKAPIIAAAYAATAAAATAAQIASIRSTTFGGGGSASSGGGGGYSRPTDTVSNDPLPSEAPREKTSVTINLQGESYSRQQVRDLIEQINEATADGAVLRLA